MNRFNQGTWSKVQCEMILSFLSFADYFRPRYFLLENVRNFVSFNKGQTFRLALASLLEMGYQVSSVIHSGEENLSFLSCILKLGENIKISLTCWFTTGMHLWLVNFVISNS